MIYLKNDFYSNFNSISQSNDEVSMKGLLIDQISSIIAYNKNGLLDLFIKVDINTSANPSNKEFTILIINNIKTNKKLQIGLAYLIAERNNILQEEAKSERSDDFSTSNVDGDKKVKPKRDFKETADVVTEISNSIKVVADTINNTNANKIQADLEGLTNNKSPEQIQIEQQNQQGLQDAEKRKKRKKTIIIAVVVVGIAVGVFIAYKKGVFTKKINNN